MKSNKIILAVLILSTIAIIFSGCGGGNPVTPPIDNDDNSEIPELTEAISQNIDLSLGGTIEVDDPESIVNGVKLIVPPMPSEKRGGKSSATMTISYIDNPYSLELPDNRGFLLPPVVINSDVTLDYECILEIPYIEADLSNMGLSSNEDIIIYHYNYISSSWEEVTANKRNFKDKTDFDYMQELTITIDDINMTYACSTPSIILPFDLGLPQPGDLLYRLSNKYGINIWLTGHVGIYVGEKAYDGVILYNVIEALHSLPDGTTIIDEVMKNYYDPISEFAGEFKTTYMGARQPVFGALTSLQRSDILKFLDLDTNNVIGQPYAWNETNGWWHGLARGELVKGDPPTKGQYETSYNCVGLAEAAYEFAGVNGGVGLVTEEDEGNNCFVFASGWTSPACVLTPAEQYAKTEPAEGYSVSGKVSDSQSKGIPGVTLNFEFGMYPFSVNTNENGNWDCGRKLGREWDVTPQKDGYTFEPSTIKVKGDANDIDFTGTFDEANHAPVISNLSADPPSVNINQTTTITCIASDPDEDPLTYDWTVNAGSFEGDISGSSVTWRAPSTEGNYSVECEASDEEASDSKLVNISVGDVNHAPVITSTAVTSATKDEPYSYNVDATDADTLTYSLTTKPGGMTINSTTGLISWTPTSTGDYNVIVKVSDGEFIATQSFTVTVEENGTSLGQVQLISPSNGTTLPPGDITFSWNPVSNATKYQFILYNSQGQVALDAIDSGTSSIVELNIEEIITWKIRAGDNSGNWGAWSSTWSLTIKSTTSYALRDIGPAGGYIFYDKGSYSGGWQYLEAAPVSTEWTGKQWGSYGTLIEGTEKGIGTGQSNTTIIVTWLNIHSETDCAAQLCDALGYGGYSDWFLPSKDELNLMYTNLKVYGVGGFVDTYYWNSSESDCWSSSELNALCAWSQTFYNGHQPCNHDKINANRVRAVRAF